MSIRWIRWKPRGEGSNPRKGGNSQRFEFVFRLYENAIPVHGLEMYRLSVVGLRVQPDRARRLLCILHNHTVICYKVVG
jgi:hypothetical protein